MSLVGKFLPLNLLYGVIPSLWVVRIVSSHAACSTNHANRQWLTGILIFKRSPKQAFMVRTIPATCLHVASVLALDDESYAAGWDSCVLSMFSIRRALIVFFNNDTIALSLSLFRMTLLWPNH